MLAYARALFSLTMKLAAFLIVIGAVAGLLIYLAAFLEPAINNFIISWTGILFSMAVAVIYLKIRALFA
jgi:hypothetical protein